MKFDHSFKHRDVSQALMLYLEERMQKLTKFEIKPGNVHVTYSRQRHLCRVVISLRGGHGEMQAHGSDKDWYMAVDSVIDKLQTQMVKYKSRIKEHKHHYKTKHAKLGLVNSGLETDYSRLEHKSPHRKVG